MKTVNEFRDTISKLTTLEQGDLAKETLPLIDDYTEINTLYENLKKENDLLRKNNESLVQANGELLSRIPVMKEEANHNESETEEKKIPISEIIAKTNKRGLF